MFQIDVTCKDVESIRVDKVCEAKKVERYCIFHQEKKNLKQFIIICLPRLHLRSFTVWKPIC